MDRSLRDMLASGDEQSLDNDVNESCEMLNQQPAIELESQLLAATITLEGEQNEVFRLKFSCWAFRIRVWYPKDWAQRNEKDTK